MISYTDSKQNNFNWADFSEIDRLQALMDQACRGNATEEELLREMRENGVYGVRGNDRLHMVRVKAPLGIISPEQIDVLATAAEKFTPQGRVHLTTRQDVELYFVERDRLPELLQHLATGGLTTREAGGDMVRNITLCAYAGISEEEIFDPTPFAFALTRHLLRNPAAQRLPRKFKIAFESCETDHVSVPVNDVGFFAAIDQDGKRGFYCYVGGGLGSAPRSAVRLEEFTAANLLLPTVDAVIRIFHQYGNRNNRARARLKYVLEQLGKDEFLRSILEERERLLSVNVYPPVQTFLNASAPAGPSAQALNALADREQIPQQAFEMWKTTSVVEQRQKGWYAVHLRPLLGNLTVLQLRAISILAAEQHLQIRISVLQQLILSWVAKGNLKDVFEKLNANELIRHGTWKQVNIVSCPGRDICRRAITRTWRLAEAIEDQIRKRVGDKKHFENMTIRISGCPNACGQHQVGDLGLSGGALSKDGRLMPCYQLFLGGGFSKRGDISFGDVTLKLPACVTAKGVVSLLEFLEKEKLEGESFHETTARIGMETIRNFLKIFSESAFAGQDGLDCYRDLGESELFSTKS